RAGGFRFEIEVRVFADVDPDAKNRSALERARQLVLLADVVAAVATDAEAVATEGELADLRPHRAMRDDLVVNVELAGPRRLLVLPGALAHELEAEDVLAGRELARCELLLRP